MRGNAIGVRSRSSGPSTTASPETVVVSDCSVMMNRRDRGPVDARCGRRRLPRGHGVLVEVGDLPHDPSRLVAYVRRWCWAAYFQVGSGRERYLVIHATMSATVMRNCVAVLFGRTRCVVVSCSMCTASTGTSLHQTARPVKRRGGGATTTGRRSEQSVEYALSPYLRHIV